MTTYRKSRRAQTSTTWETWVEDDYANTLTVFDVGESRATSLVVDDGGVRRLTPVELERLQGFPDDWTAGGSPNRRARQLGNAVCVPVAEWIGRRIVAETQR